MKTSQKMWVEGYHSPCGNLVLGSVGDKLCLCNWSVELHPGRVAKRLQELLGVEAREGASDVTQEARRQLDAYFRRERRTFDVPLLFAGSDFQQCVWRELLTIPYGETVAYGELARRLGRPKAVRAVANANGANAISIFVPCHRVVGSDGSLTGYGGGMEAKRFLLALERGK